MNAQVGKSDLVTLLPDLNAGVFEQQINRALSDVAANCVTHGKAGSVTLTFKMKQIGEGSQVNLTHSIKSVVPKPRGKVTEEATTDTPLHVQMGGRLTLFPSQKQASMDLGAGAATGRTDIVAGKTQMSE
jgi:hypothetical protein